MLGSGDRAEKKWFDDALHFADHDALFAGGFRGVEGFISVGDELLGVDGAAEIDVGDADRHADACSGIGYLTDGVLKLADDAFGDALGFVSDGLRHEDAEFVPAVSRWHIDLAAIGANDLGRELEDLVAALVTHGVVERFEAVEVDHQERQRPVVAGGFIPGAIEHFVEPAAVAEARKLIGARHRLQLRDEHLHLLVGVGEFGERAAEIAMQSFVLVLDALMGHRFFDGQRKRDGIAAEVDDEIDSAGANALDGERRISVFAEENHGELRPDAAKIGQNVESGAIGKRDAGDDDIDLIQIVLVKLLE